MIKLLVALISGLVVAAVMLQMRQQRLELSHECSRLHEQIEDAQIRLWNQQLQIATYTTPNAIRQTVKHYDISLVPSKPYLPRVNDPAQ